MNLMENFKIGTENHTRKTNTKWEEHVEQCTFLWIECFEGEILQVRDLQQAIHTSVNLLSFCSSTSKGKNRLLDSGLLILTNTSEHAVHTIARINRFQYQFELKPAHFPFGVLCFANDYSIPVSPRKVPRQLIQSTCSLPPKWKDEKGLLLSKTQAPLVLSTSSGVHQILLWASLIHYNSKLLSIFPGYFSAISVN